MRAVQRENVPLVKTLLEAGAEVNTEEKDGVTALHYAVLRRVIKKESLEIASMLLNAGANPNKVSKRPMFPGTPLEVAVDLRLKPLVDLLLPLTRHRFNPASLSRMKWRMQ